MPSVHRHPIRRFFQRRFNNLAALVVLALLLGQLGRLHWFAELFSHYTHAYAGMLLLAALFGHGRQRLLWLSGALLLGLWLLQPRHTGPQPGDPDWSLLFYNVHIHNRAAAIDARVVLEQQADLLALAEIDLDNPGWSALRQAYPHGCEHHEASPFAMALWSKQPLRDCQLHFSAGFVWIRALHADGTAIYALHPPPPVNAALAQARQHYMDEVSRHMAQDRHYLAAGDLNASPFSPLFRDWLHQAGARSNTPNWTPTWRPLWLNIDHVLSRSDHPVHTRSLPWLHSDHRPPLVQWRKPDNRQ